MPNYKKLHAQKKGKRGEVEFCKWLKDNLDINVERNYNQADGHSSDIITDNFLFEVKRRENLDLDAWWYQVIIAQKNTDENLIPVVAYRKNRSDWNFLLPLFLMNIFDKGYFWVNELNFIRIAQTLQNAKITCLTEEGRELELDFGIQFGDGSCYCSTTSNPPCSYCENSGTHEGNPEALAQEPNMWTFMKGVELWKEIT